MSFTVGGSTPQLTFADATVQNTAALPLTGGSVSADITVNGLTVGRGAGAVATNTAVGASALAPNTTGAYNTAVGYQAGYTNTTGAYNTAVGYQAGYTNTTGGNNSFIGQAAGYAVTTGSDNATLGFGALASGGGSGGAASNNVAIGSSALKYNTANNNTAVGYQAGYSNTTGSTLDAFGYQAGYSNTTGQYNTFLGRLAGYSNQTGNYNLFVGEGAGYTTTGSANTFIGAGAGYSVSSGAKNTILGGYSGNQGGLDIRTASNNIVLSDGDGNPRQYYDSLGYPAVKAGTSGGFQYVTKKFATVQSNVNNPTVSLVTFSGGTTNQACMIKVRVFQLGLVGVAGSAGNEHIGLGWVWFSGSAYSTYVNTMTVTTNISNTNVGTLSWSGQTLQYTTNRLTNYDAYYIEVEVTQNNGGTYTITLNF